MGLLLLYNGDMGKSAFLEYPYWNIKLTPGYYFYATIIILIFILKSTTKGSKARGGI